MSRNYRSVKFVNLSMNSLGTFSNECSMFLDMMNDIGIDKKQQHYIIRKMINIAIRATYSGLLIFRAVVDLQNSGFSAKSRKIPKKKPRNTAKSARNISKYMSAKHISYLSWLLDLF